MAKLTVNTSRRKRKTEALSVWFSSDYTLTCYDRLESDEHGSEAATLTGMDLRCSLLRHFCVISEIRSWQGMS